MRPRYKAVTPDQKLRDLRKELKTFAKEEPGPDRAARLAAFTRAAHEERQLNMAMHTAQMCLDEDPDAPALLVAAYRDGHGDAEDRMRALSDLEDLGRYLQRDDMRQLASRQLDDAARAYVQDVDEGERRRRLRTVASVRSHEFADRLRDELEFLG